MLESFIYKVNVFICMVKKNDEWINYVLLVAVIIAVGAILMLLLKGIGVI